MKRKCSYKIRQTRRLIFKNVLFYIEYTQPEINFWYIAFNVFYNIKDDSLTILILNIDKIIRKQFL